MSSSESTKAPESYHPSLGKHRNLAYNILRMILTTPPSRPTTFADEFKTIEIYEHPQDIHVLYQFPSKRM
ncbi:unnamed protein product [Rhizophagus irregularis]|nr:unnamed protein product [Rhizophagus irregularis]